MLQPAKLYEAKLNEQMASTVMDPYYKLYYGGFPNLEEALEDSLWSKIQLVSIVNDKVIGYFKASVDRPGNYIDSITCVHFSEGREQTKMAFAMDMRRFLKYLTEDLAMPKLAWSVYRGNPVEEHYNRLIKKFGGRVMGIDRYATKICGKWYDLKHYEWIADYHVCTHCGTKVKKEQEVMCWKCGIGEMIYHNPFEGA